MMTSLITRKTHALLFVVAIVYASTAVAEFLEMPEIEHFRDVEEKTLLQDLDVPAVRDRSPDPTAGPRLAVSEFRIQGLIEFPELGITREALTEMVESIRSDIMSEGKLLESGYTTDELAEVSNLLVEIEEETMERHVSPLEVQKLVWLIREQRGKRGVTLGQIEAVANEITHFYRERGFVLAKAFIPKQRVRDGVVTLTLLLGVLGEVLVKSNAMYDAGLLDSVFDDLLTKPVTNKMVEEGLFIVNSFPGIRVDGYFEPGYQVGDTRLNINVRNESRYNANLRVDNHGTDESGLYRFYADFQLNNLLGIADYIKVGMLRAKSPDNTTYGQLAFESNFFSPRFRVGIESSRNQFVVDQSESSTNIELNGEVDVLSLYGKYIKERGRTRNSGYEFRAETVASDLQIGNLPDINNALDEELRNFSIKYVLDFLDDASKRLHEGSIKYTRGNFKFGKKDEQDENYDILSADYTLLTFLRVPFTESTSRLVFRSALQYSGTNLSPIARFSLAGPLRTRGFAPNFFTADDAFYLGTDWVFDSPEILDVQAGPVNLKEFFRPFLFFDYGYGKQHTLAPGEKNSTGQLANVGIGLQFSHGYNFSGNLQLGYKVLNQFTGITEPEADSKRLLFDMQYSF